MEKGKTAMLLHKIWDTSKKRKTAEPPGSGFLRVETSETLLNPHANRLKRIREMVGLSELYWHRLYYVFIVNVAEFVQLLPASETHHHAEHGGLLLHILESVEAALRLRRAEIMPAGASPEIVSEQQELWSYAIATAAALHDIGKPLTDQIIEYHNGNTFSQWQPLQSGRMTAGHWYRASFNSARKYRLHQVLPALVARQLTPSVGFSWLCKYTQVLDEWAHTLTGHKQHAGAIGAIVGQADQTSVASYLNNNRPANLAVAGRGTLTLATRLAMTLRQLIDTEALPLNRPGAAAFVIDGCLWCVSKRVLDAIRAQLIRDGVHSVPTNNNKLMDELMQAGYIESNDSKAIWNVAIRIDDWRQSFSLIRFPLDRLWPSDNTGPAVCAGGAISIDPPAGEGGEISDKKDEPLVTKCEAISPDTEITAQPKPAPAPETKQDDPNIGQAFIDWISNGIEHGGMKINAADAKLHVVKEGLLIVSPAIFRWYAGEHNNEFKYDQVQKRFQKMKLNKKTPQGTNIWSYRITGTEKKSVIKGMLIPDAARILKMQAELPARNPRLALMALEESAD